MKGKVLSYILSVAMVVALIPAFVLSSICEASALAYPSNPTQRYDSADHDYITTWDCIYFGNYWQDDTNGDGKADQNDEKTPIKWRVLSVSGDDAFLLADKCLDGWIPYNVDSGINPITWEASSIREWLNNDFMNSAFTGGEQNGIITAKLANADNPEHGTEGGSDTEDKVFLLSIDEASNAKYGFITVYDDSEYSFSDARVAYNTAYTAGKDYRNSPVNEEQWWFLRSPGKVASYAAMVAGGGVISVDGGEVRKGHDAIRPALHLDLSSTEWKSAGAVDLNGNAYASMLRKIGTATLSATTYTYDGSVKKPSVTVKDSNGNTLVKDTDYTVSYASGCKAPGKYSVTVKGSGSCSGTITKTFKINPKATTQYTPSRASRGFTAKWKKSSSVNCSGYQIRYSRYSSMSNAKIKTVSGNSKTSSKITKLKAKKTYYVQVRCYKTVNGIKYYSKWSAKKSVKTR